MKTSINLKATIATRARQIARGAVKQRFRDDGGRNQDFRISDHATAIMALANDPTILEKARADVELWLGAKFKTSAQNRNG